MMIVKRAKILSVVLLLSGCGTYKSSFNCSASKGVYCASMDHVDEMISSGEIERFNEQRNKRKYRTAEPVPATFKKEQTLEIISYEATDASN